MERCRLSIIVPVYNAEAYLDRCVASVLDQEFGAYELILVDDGSTDASGDMCDGFASEDSRIRTIRKSNGGVSSARNAGLEIAEGEYVMFLDSDDVLLPYALEDLMSSVSGTEDMLVGGYAVFVGGKPVKDLRPDSTKIYWGADYPVFFQENLRRNCEMLDAPWAKLFRRSAIGFVRFNENLNYAEDKLFVFTMLSRCSSIKTLSSAVYGYHIHEGSLGSDLTSDKHIRSLMVFLPLYAESLASLADHCKSSSNVNMLYHNDLVGRYICRILNIFATRRTDMLTKENIGLLYGYMKTDSSLGVLSLRPGQIVNLFLYKIGRPGLTLGFYRFTSFITSIFRKRR